MARTLKLKAGYQASAKIFGGDNKPLRFDLKKAQAFITPEKGVVKEVLVNGHWCPLFLIPVSATVAEIGVSLRGINLEAVDKRDTRLAPSAPKVSAPESRPDPNDLFGVESDLE